MLNRFGTDFELNVIARVLADHFGYEAVFAWKLFTLTVFTAAILGIRKHSRSMADAVGVAAWVVSLMLSIWLDIVAGALA